MTDKPHDRSEWNWNPLHWHWETYDSGKLYRWVWRGPWLRVWFN